MPRTRFPRWRKTYDLNMCRDTSEPLKIVVYDKDKFSQDKFMGKVRRREEREGGEEKGEGG